MSTWKAILGIVSVFAVMFVICALTIWVEKKYPGENYDERQKLSRGNAFRLAFWVGFVYYMLVALILNLDNAPGDTWFSLIMFGLMGQGMILHIYCFLTHSALPLDDKPRVAIVGWMIIGVLDLLQYFTIDMPDGLGVKRYTQLIVGCCFILLSIMHLISHLRQIKE